MLGVGIWNLTSDLMEEPFAEFERWRAWPRDIVGGLQSGCCQSRLDPSTHARRITEEILSIKDNRDFQKDGGETARTARGFKLTAMCALKSSALFTLAPRRLEVYFSPSRPTRIEVGG